MDLSTLPRYDWRRSYEWNYEHAPDPVDFRAEAVPGRWNFCGLNVDSPLGIPAGPLLNGRWCLYYASLGFDVLTYKTVRSSARTCYELPNLQPVRSGPLSGGEADLPAADEMAGSWAVSFGMPSKDPEVWRRDVAWTRRRLAEGKRLVVSVVGTIQPEWTIDELADDYARCAAWAVESGADAVEANFSCPNVATCDGQLYHNVADAREVAERIRSRIGSLPLILKIGHVTERELRASLLEGVHDVVDALAMTNSIASTVVGHQGNLLFSGQKRGICGAAILDSSCRQLDQFAQLIRRRQNNLQLIGVGGVSELGHVRDYLTAGAHAVQIATAAMTDPGVGLRIRREWSGDREFVSPGRRAAES